MPLRSLQSRFLKILTCLKVKFIDIFIKFIHFYHKNHNNRPLFKIIALGMNFGSRLTQGNVKRQISMNHQIFLVGFFTGNSVLSKCPTTLFCLTLFYHHGSLVRTLIHGPDDSLVYSQVYCISVLNYNDQSDYFHRQSQS